MGPTASTLILSNTHTLGGAVNDRRGLCACQTPLAFLRHKWCTSTMHSSIGGILKKYQCSCFFCVFGLRASELARTSRGLGRRKVEARRCRGPRRGRRATKCNTLHHLLVPVGLFCVDNERHVLIACHLSHHLVSYHLVCQVAMTWPEVWHEGLEEASRMYFGDGNVEGMLQRLQVFGGLVHTLTCPP